MADVNIDWGLLGQPNELSQFYKGQDDAQQNDLLQWQTARAKTQAGRDDLDYASKQATQAALTAAKAKAAPKLAAQDYRGAAGDMAGADPATAKSYLEIQNSLSEQDQKVSAAADGIIASAYPTLKAMPVGTGQRKQFWDSQVAPQLKQIGAPAQVVDGFDPDNQQALDARYNHALGANGVREQGNSDRDYQEKMSAPVIIEGVAYDRKTMKPIAAPSQVKEVGGDSFIRPGFGPGIAPGAAPDGGAAGAPPPPGPSQSVTVPGPVGNQITQAATAAGATPDEQAYLHRTAQLESGGNPAAQNGKSTGLFQFHPDTFASVGGKNIADVGDQTTAALTLARQDKAALTQALGREPTPAELYIAHQQGGPGAAAILTADPNASAVSVLMPIYRNPAVATQAIVRNGGKPNMTAGQFADLWRSKYGDAPASAPAASTAPSAAADPTAWKALPHDDSGDLTTEAVDYVAQQYMITGQLPPLGMGKQATVNRDKIINRAQAIEAETGATGRDAVLRHAQVKTDSAALSKITGLRTQIEASEKTVQRNADYMLSLAPKGGGPTGSPALNTPIQYVRKQLAGSPDVAKFDQAIGTVADEYAKVMTSNTGSGGVSSDSARAEAYARLSKAATFGQLQQTVSAMTVEMGNRVASYRDQEATLQASIKGGPKASGAAAPSRVIRYNAQGQRVQ